MHHFYRLLGDVDGDEIVDANDLNEIAASINETSPMGWAPLSADVSGAGTVTDDRADRWRPDRRGASWGQGSRWDKRPSMRSKTNRDALQCGPRST